MPRLGGATTAGKPFGAAAGAVALGTTLVAAGLVWRRWSRASLEGEVALVTGGSRGLGYLLARQLLEAGCRVAICGRDPTTLERAVARLERETGGEIAGWPCDVGDAAAVERLVASAMDRFGRVDMLINNAGIIQVGPLQTMRLEEFRNAMDADYWGTVHATLAVLPHMRRRHHGRIVNITSIAGIVAVPHLLPYGAAKHAKLGFSEGLRTEVAADGIAVTTVVPGLMRTGSPVHVNFRGQPGKEYAWFVLGSISPVSTMSAQRAAARIVRAIQRREARVTLTWQAKLLRMIHDLAPTATAHGLELASRLLPSDNGRAMPPDSAEGTALRGVLPVPFETALDRAARRTNQ